MVLQDPLSLSLLGLSIDAFYKQWKLPPIGALPSLHGYRTNKSGYVGEYSRAVTNCTPINLKF
jgi:hypothetical protein